MPPRVIGAGLPRTGTSSLTAALQALGCGPVLHGHAGDGYAYLKLLRAKKSHPDKDIHELQRITGVSLANLVAPYNATTDSPAMDFTAELLELYPDSVVILSVRDSDEQWWTSFYETFGVYFGDNLQGLLLRLLIWPVWSMSPTKEVVAEYIAGWKRRYGCFTSDIHSIHNVRIQQQVPPDRLLVYNVKQGWDPLCKFLNVPIPNEPFPNVNDKKEMLANVNKSCRKGYYIWASILSVAVMAIYRAYEPMVVKV
ncbi:hypothetical protein EYZ11_011526 [Aspergillus tanneri]|uniref:P-loop containing nucleoside triphosphate hydrolase protein n=1 Tax=Aspergillus tanneri TaxID=1220188 RepID=A0A4S3J2K8_9EURO|nr:uncharacterized protein ATNIH1004_009410 [Aspergillus tanneri]KAA8645193.1 hypothetical protein ATNIH1004_009410 [Aspergillus tanneri]THC89020.1 hypothetical protein EYZ11_011526 [Aspergillus tanneri]